MAKPHGDDSEPLERRDRDNLERMLRQQHEILVVSGQMFDAGHQAQALSLSSAITNVVYDVLVALGVRDSLLFKDSASHPDPANLIRGNPAFVVMAFGGGPGQITWVAPGPHGRENPDLPFAAWWSMPLTIDVSEPPNAWSRKDFVMQVRNKDGGGHVDPHLPKPSLRALEEEGTLGWHRTDPLTGEKTMMNGPILPSVRQIAWELEATIEPLVGIPTANADGS